MMLVFYGIRWHFPKKWEMKFGHSMLALHVLSATARILIMPPHVRAQDHRVRALTNGLCNHSTNHDQARPYLCSHKSKNANNNAPSTRLIPRQCKSCCIPYMLSITLYIQYTPMPVYYNQWGPITLDPWPYTRARTLAPSTTLVSNRLTIINHHH